MKKRSLLITVLAIVAAVTLSFGLTACGEKNTNLAYEAYQYYVENNGFTGTFEEWVSIFKGQDGLDGSAVEKGDQGEKGEAGDVAVESATQTALRSAVSILCPYTYTYNNPFSGTKTAEATQAGSGVIYKYADTDGNGTKDTAYIITNYHVVYSSTLSGVIPDLYVYVYGAQTFLNYTSASVTDQAAADKYAMPATYVGGTMNYDIAVLAVNIENNTYFNTDILKPVTLSDSNDVRLGDTALVVGNAEGAGLAATLGIVSLDSEYIKMTAADEKTTIYFRVMRTDAAVNSGNSGGGMFDKNGKLIGIVNAKTIDSNVDNMAYAIPVSIAYRCADRIISINAGQTGFSLPVVGITSTASETSAKIDSNGKLYTAETVSVASVDKTSVASDILQTDDVIKSVTLNGKTYEITRTFNLGDIMLEANYNDTLSFDIVRGGIEMTVKVVLTKTKSVL